MSHCILGYGRHMRESSSNEDMTTKVWVGNLGKEGDRHELWEAFKSYGELRDVWVARNPPGFAFVEFYDARDARDAVDALDGERICGQRVKVELSHGRSRDKGRGGGGGGGGRYGRRRSRSRSRSPRRFSRSPKRSPPRFSRRSRSRSPGRH